MRRLLMTLLVTIALLPLSTHARPIAADAGHQQGADARWQVEQDLVVAQGNCKSLNQAIAQVKRQYPNGRILSAETRGKVHHIKVLTQDNKVRTVKVQGC